MKVALGHQILPQPVRLEVEKNTGAEMGTGFAAHCHFSYFSKKFVQEKTVHKLRTCLLSLSSVSCT